MKTILFAGLLVALVACTQPVPTAQPKVTPTKFSEGKPTPTEPVIELTKPQPKPAISRILFLSHATFRELPADAAMATFPVLPVPTPDFGPTPVKVRAIVWDILNARFYTYEVASGNVMTDGWSGPGVLGTTLDENERRVMTCARACNQWPVPVYRNIEISSFPAKPVATSYDQPWWAPRRDVDPTMSDALVVDFKSGDRYFYRFPSNVRAEFGTGGWYFGPIRGDDGNHVIGVCFDRCNEVPAPKQ